MSTDATEDLPTAPLQPILAGVELRMEPLPASSGEPRAQPQRLERKVAVVTGADSGIGRATALAFAREGADVAIVYLDDHEGAERTCRDIEALGCSALAIAGDIGDEAFAQSAIAQALEKFERIDVLVNNAGEQHLQTRLEDITAEQLERTFRTNVFGMFFMTKAALKHLAGGSTIINTSSVTAYAGNAELIDYAATKGAIVAFTRSLALSLIDRGIRVNAVAPGPIWTPLIPATFPSDELTDFGLDTPMKRPGQPEEVAACFVFLASDDSSYMSGQTLHPNGGRIVNS